MKRRGRLLIIVIMLIIMGCMSISVKGAETSVCRMRHIPLGTMTAAYGAGFQER